LPASPTRKKKAPHSLWLHGALDLLLVAGNQNL
jgi:hypothetical protein